MNYLKANDVVRKTKKGLVKCHAFDRRSFGVVAKATKTKVYVVPGKTNAISIQFKKDQLNIKVDSKDVQIFPMPKLVKKYDHIFKDDNV